MGIPPDLIRGARRELDLAEPAHRESLRALAGALLDLPESATAEIEAAARAGDAPLEFRIAARLAASRRFTESVETPVKIAVVFAMWGEHNRLRPRSAANPNGEDSLRVKLEQLAWATRGTPVDWTLYAVDDGCPRESGRIAARIARGHPLGRRVRVLHLADALPAESGPLRTLAGADDSRKGGAVLLGCAEAIREGADAVIYTDADNSVHLGQVGLLLRPWLEEGTGVVLGDRKHPDAVLVKAEDRWGIGIKVLRHMQRMVGRAIFQCGIRDTQAAFKLYRRDTLERIIAAPTVFDFSFDTDWILAVIAMGEPFATVPFAFIDSAAESASLTQGPMTTWETLLKGLVRATRARGVDHDREMARVVEEEIRSAADLELLIDHLPPELEAADDARLGDPAVMPPAAVQAWIRRRKGLTRPPGGP